MEFTWQEYQKSKHIVMVFEENRRKIHDKRMFSRSAYGSFDRITPRTKKEILNYDIWHKRFLINREMYSIRKLIESNDIRNVSLINGIIDDMRLELLELRKQSFLMDLRSRKYRQ